MRRLGCESMDLHGNEADDGLARKGIWILKALLQLNFAKCGKETLDFNHISLMKFIVNYIISW